MRSVECTSTGCINSCEEGEALIGGYCLNRERGLQHIASFVAGEGKSLVECEHQVKQVVAVCLKQP
ncbi:hypothetical protein [Bosea sp. 117]|uniref:hypothetical protein n=1 Tax=Bosea sp. 117 TaxID=1125973 RepID=UPI000A6621AD|nr:hypothetical protein [Bosea sp. 117]